MSWLIPLEQIDRQRADEVGGKASTLGELSRAGLPVPVGFVILAEAPTGPALAEAIEVACADLGDGLFAVRSSATGEDSAGASFAGQHDSFLGIPPEAVQEHALRCRASLHSERAGAYRRQLGLSDQHARMPVLVQRMVEARAAGVAFTLDPEGGDRSKVVIEASWGLGTAVALGEVLPDRWKVDKVLGEVEGPGRSHKPVEWLRVGEGVRSLSVDSGRWSVPCLAPSEVRALAALATRTEALLGAPQDIEWAIDGAGLHLLQSRPETIWSRRLEPRLEMDGPWSRLMTRALTSDD